MTDFMASVADGNSFSENDSPVISIKNLNFRYDSEEDEESVIDFQLKNINLDVNKGEFIAFLGANGSGKSTLAKLINSQMKPTEGDIIVYGMNTKDENRVWDIRACCGMVFQNPDNQIIATIVEEDVAFGPENLGLPRNEIISRIDKSLEIVNMLEYRKHSPNLLSGGQKQRVAIAGILALEPDIIIFDESTSMLDPGGRKDVMDTIIKLNKEQNKTVIIITHFMDEAIYADKIFVINNGEIAMQGAPLEVFKDSDKISKYGLDVPFISEMNNKLSDLNIDLKNFDMEDYVNCLLSKQKI